MNTKDNTPKRYRLLKFYPSLPYDWAVGMELGQGDRGIYGSYSPCNGKYTNRYIERSEVEGYKTYYEEVLPVSEPVKVRVDCLSHHDNLKGNGSDCFWYQFCTSTPIANVHFYEINKSIEKVLNNDTVVEDNFWDKIQNFCDREMDKYANKKYTQSEVDTIRKEAFEAGRVRDGGLSYGRLRFKYESYEQYLSSLNLNTNDTGKEDIRDNKINLLEEDLECVHLYLDDINIPRKDDKGQVYSIVGRIKELGMKWMMKISEIESEYLSKQQPTNDNTFVWTDELVLLLCDLCHHNGWHKFGKKVVEIFDEFKSVSSKKWVFPSWIKEHLQSKQSPPLSEIKEGEDKPVLFTTEDGVDIKIGDDYWVWDFGELNNIHRVNKASRTHTGSGIYRKYFSTKEAAEQYIIDNKPCLSLNDVMKFVEPACHPSEENFDEIGLRDFVTKKLKSLNP